MYLYFICVCNCICICICICTFHLLRAALWVKTNAASAELDHAVTNRPPSPFLICAIQCPALLYTAYVAMLTLLSYLRQIVGRPSGSDPPKPTCGQSQTHQDPPRVQTHLQEDRDTPTAHGIALNCHLDTFSIPHAQQQSIECVTAKHCSVKMPNGHCPSYGVARHQATST